MNTTKNRTILYIIIGLAAALIIGGVIAVNYASNANSPARLMSLGERYLSELNYEQAVAQFLKVIEIEPMNERAYVGTAEAYVGLGQTENAIAILERGLEALPESEAIKRMLKDLIPEPEPEPEQQNNDGTEQISDNVQEYLQQLYALCEAGDKEQIMAAVRTGEFEDIASLSYESEPLFYSPFSGADNKNGKGLGIYSGEYLYFGNYAENERNGEGIWMTALNNYIFEGLWSGDKPNGYGEERSGKKDSVSTYTGNLADGLWHGDIQHTDRGNTYFCHFADGIATIISEKINGRGDKVYQYGETADGSGSVYYLENNAFSRHGIAGFSD